MVSALAGVFLGAALGAGVPARKILKRVNGRSEATEGRRDRVGRLVDAVESLLIELGEDPEGRR